MSLASGLQLFYPLASNTDELINSDNATNSGIVFGTHSGVVSADFQAPAHAFAANSSFNFSFGTGDFTFSVWVNPDTVSYGPASQGTIFGTDFPNYELSIYQGNIQCYLLGAANSISTTSGGAITTGAWQHVVLVRTGGTVTIYVDNVSPAQSPAGSPGTTDITSTGSPQFQIGQRVSSANNHYDGKMSDVALWTRALNGSEITDIFSAGAGGLSGLLIGNQSSINLFTSVVHNVTPVTTNVTNLYTSVVHDSTPPTANAINLYTSVVHDSTPATSNAINLFSSVVHGAAAFSVPDITGTVGVTASFDAASMGFNTSSVHYRWSWQSVPSGSSITNAILPLQDGASTYPVIGMTGLYHFDDGTADDSSGNGNNGTIDGATATGDSYVGDQALFFDGNNDKVTLLNPDQFGIDGNNSRTISFWASASAWVDNDVFFGFGTNSNAQDFTFLQRSGPDLQLNLWGGDLRVSANESVGWNHYFVIYDDSETTSYIYQNNQLLGSLNRSLNTDNSNPITIGNGFGIWNGNYFGGVIDEFAIWPRAITSCERSVIYNFLQTGSLEAASGSSVNLLEQFSFVPDVSGSYLIDLEIVDNSTCSSITGTVSASISSAGPTPPGPTPVITGSNPTVNLVESADLGYVFNTYKIQNLSVQRSRTTEQVPFKIGTKGKQSLRISTNTEFTGSS